MNRGGTTPPRPGERGGSLEATLLSRRAIQLYTFIFVIFIALMRSQWIVSMPSSLDTSVLSRHDADPRSAKDQLGALQTPYEKSQRDSANVRIRDSLRKETRRNLDPENPHQVVIGPNGDAHESFLPRNQDIIESIYARGKHRIQEEFKRRNSNISAIEPFNPWGPVYIWDWFSPDYNCPTMERIGRVGDGGKWICGVDILRTRKCLMYSYGVNKDLSFELEMVGRTGCEVHAFDPTVGGVPPDCKDNPHINFHKQALGPKTGPTDVFMLIETLLDTMKKEGHSFIDVLKVDIEGSEWDTFKALLPEKALPFGQLLIELHFRNVEEVFEFFDNMDTHGFRIFMRETNHNPCAAGKLPIAVEFSLINPDAYFTGVPDRAAVQAIAARPEPVTYDGVIYVLSHKGNIHRLTQMLISFEKNFNRRYGYPLVIYHEDFTAEHKHQLQDSVHMELTFRHVNFSIPEWLDKDKIPERTPCSYHSSTIGYRHMNRFLAYFAAEELSKEYEWQWRLDDDSLITEEIGYDVFDLMAQNKKRYGFTNIVQDDAKCVLGLWNATREYIDHNKLETTFFARWTEGAVFYNNFEVSHRSVWMSEAYKHFFNHIDRLGGIYYHRWGDAPIRSIGVSLFVNETEVHQFSDIAYTHKPFIQRNATGLPSPKHTLFNRAASGSFAGNCSEPSADGHGHGGSGNNGTCLSGKPSGVIFTVLNDEPDTMSNLKATLESIDTNYNDQFHYPIAVFGSDLSYERRSTIRGWTRSVVEFHDLAFLTQHDLPSWIDKDRVPPFVDCAFADDSVEDRKRNRYMAYDGVNKLSSQYDWLWKIAPGAVLTENVTSDPFATLAMFGKSYGYMMTVTDDKRCIKGLHSATQAFINNNITESKRRHLPVLEPTFFHVLPEDSVFYQGFEISHASLWQSVEYKTFFDYMDREGGMIYHRWTEANLATAALSLFTPANQLYRFSDMGFEHAPFIKQVTNRNVIKNPIEDTWQGRGITVENETDFASLVAPRRVGFLGSDVATSFRLPSVAGYGDYAWLFGDTYVGTHDGNKRDSAVHIISNALAFLPAGSDVSASDVDFFWRQGKDETPASSFIVEGKSDILLWPVSGFSVEYEGTAKVVLLAQRVLKKHNLTEFLVADGMNFEVEGTSLIIVDNPAATPSRWQYRVVNMPETDGTHNWFSAVAIENGKEVADSPRDYVYLVGNAGTRGIGVFDEESKNVLSRIKVADLLALRFDELQMLVTTSDKSNYDSWVRGASADIQRPVFRPANPEISLQYNKELGVWVALEVDGVTAQLVLWTAPQVGGPWSSTVVHSISAPYDDLTKYRCYAGKGHPELASTLPGQGVELVYSYVCNSPQDSRLLFEEGQLALYTPQFVRIKLSPRGGNERSSQ